MYHKYISLSLAFTKYNARELGITSLIQEVESIAIPADRILFHSSGLTLCLYFYHREEADQKRKEAEHLVKEGKEKDLFLEFINRIHTVMTMEES